MAKAIKNVEKKIPKDLNGKIKVIESLYKKYVDPTKLKDPNHAVSNALPENVVSTVKQFYVNDSISVQFLGKKDTILVEGLFVGKRFLGHGF